MRRALVDSSEWKDQTYYALVEDKTGKVFDCSGQLLLITGTEEAEENSIELISMDRYAELFGRKFSR